MRPDATTRPTEQPGRLDGLPTPRPGLPAAVSAGSAPPSSPARRWRSSSAAAPALAVREHSFDPVRSLTGACSNTSILDEVEDPGCPYPPPSGGGPHPLRDACGVATDRKG